MLRLIFGATFSKIYAKPEEEIRSERDTLDHVATFAIHAKEVRVAPLPWPRSDLPWGATSALAEEAGAALRPPPRPPTGIAQARPRPRTKGGTVRMMTGEAAATTAASAEAGSEPVYTIVGDKQVGDWGRSVTSCFAIVKEL